MENYKNKNLKECNLGFFMTEGLDLSKWDDIGMFSREVEPYNILADYFEKVFIFTYGDRSELNYQDKFKDNVVIVYKKSKLPNKIYSWLLPFFNKKIIKQLNILKTNQMLGSQAALISKIINKKAKLVVRTGYSLSFTVKQKNKFIFYRLISLFEYIVYKFADFSLVTSEKIYDDIVNRYKVKKSKISKIANYINTDIFKPDRSIEKNSNKIVYVGRVVKEKNLLSLIEAMDGLNLELDIIGGGEDPFKKNIIEKANNLNIKINFLGNFPNAELPKVLNRYNLFILPSFYEGMPKTLLEAMSCGLACIGTNVEGIKELIIDGENGLLVEVNSASIKEAILQINNNKDLQNRLGENARKYILDNFSLQNQIKKEICIYEKIV